MGRLKLAAALAALMASLIAPAFANSERSISGIAALKKLMDGNDRYVHALRHPNRGALRRAQVAQGQHPIAIVLGCSDSRVPPEILFDQGLGDLFIVRVAGNIADPVVLGSIEYAAEHLGVPLLMVLGHERCGAVAASVQGGEAPGHIGSLVEAIMPAVLATRDMPGDHVDNAVVMNVRNVVGELGRSRPILAHLVETQQLKVVGGYYDLDTGAVELVP